MSNTKDFEKKRNEILDCAERLFVKRGYVATTVNAILKERNIAKGTFYYYFESKEEVMDAVIMRIVKDDLEHAKQIFVKEEMPAFDKLVAILFHKPNSVHKETLLENIYIADNALMKQRALQRTIEYICPVLADIVKEGNAEETFSSNNPLADIQFLIAGIQVLQDLSNLDTTIIAIEFEAVLGILFRVLQIDEQKISKEQARGKIMAKLGTI